MKPPDSVSGNGTALAGFLEHRDAARLLASRTAATDSSIVSAWSECLANATPLAIAAVGGYGRRELFPFSDVDLLILVSGNTALAGLRDSLAPFLSMLWDSGLRISHSVRTVDDCCRLHTDNPELHISLLDVRYVAGNLEVYAELASRLPAAVLRLAPTLISRLTGQARQRHAKFNDTPYHLEPNVKESPGGIRDIHLLHWLVALQPEALFLRESLFGHHEEPTGKDWLFCTRCFLHLRAGRDSNLLTFEMQDEAARSLPPQPLQPEEWMRQYFHHARQIYRLSLRAIEFSGTQKDSGVLQYLNQKRIAWSNRDLTSPFAILRNRVHLRTPDRLFASAEETMRLFGFVAHSGAPLSWDTQRTLRSQFETISQAFQQAPASWATWSDLLRAPHAAVALSGMQETGILAAAIPQWCSIDSLVVRDFYHRYTVDEHTLVALRKIDQLSATGPEETHPFGVLAREDGPSAELRLALLLHDIGKGTTPGDHLRGSRMAAREVMAHLNVPEASQQAVQFLIRHHLDLSILMNGRDLEDAATARLLTSEIDTIENLRRLTLLTFADISAVNPTAMSPWRLDRLWSVYTLGVQQLTRELASDRIHSTATGFQDDLSPEIADFLDGFPKRYIRTHSRDQIRHHYELSRHARLQGVAVEVVDAVGTYRLTVIAHDQQGLFASLCGVLASFGMDIVKGEAFSNASHTILDVIRFTDPNQTLALNPEEVGRLQSTVQNVVAGAVQVAALLKKRRPFARRSGVPAIPPTVRFLPEASENATLIDFTGADRPGLLYDLATAIHQAGCNIEVVMIDTEAYKAIDVFYVTHLGLRLDEPSQRTLKVALLSAARGPDSDLNPDSP